MKSRALGALGALLALAACTLTASACGTSRAQPCYPSRLAVSPATVPPGGKVVLSSGPFECKDSYPPGKTYTLFLGPWSLGTVPVNQDGSFAASLVIPPNVPAGQVNLAVRGSAFDTPCKDTRNASCAIYLSPLLTIQSHQ